MPIDRKSTCSRIRSASRAAAGTSIITPGVRPWARHCAGEVRGLGGGGDHRRHHPRLVARRLRRGGDALELPRQDAGVAVGDADATHAERRVGLIGVAGELQRLVRSCVEGADHHLAAGERGQHLAVDGRLLVDRGFGVLVQEAAARCGTGRRPPRAFHCADRAAAPSWTLARIATRARRRWRPARSTAWRGRHRRWATATALAARVGVGRDGDGAERAVDHDHRARGHRVESVDGDDARDAELPGDDRGVAGGPTERGRERDHQEASRPAVSTGARSSAHRIDGTSGTGTPGSGSPLSSAMTRSRMSRRSVTRSAIRPPSWVNIVTNCSTAPMTAPTAALPSPIRFSAAPIHARS